MTSHSIASPTAWRSSSLSGFGPEVMGLGHYQGDHYQSLFSPQSGDYQATPLNPTFVQDPRSSAAPDKLCMTVVDPATGAKERKCRTCYDVHSGRGPTLTCTMEKPEPFDPVTIFETFVRALTIPPKLGPKEKAARWAKAFSLLHPTTQEGWGHAIGFQRKIYDPRSLFSCLSRVLQFWVDYVQMDPNEAKAKMNVRVLDRLYTTHALTIHFERNTRFDSFLNRYPEMEWKIKGIYPEEYLFA